MVSDIEKSVFDGLMLSDGYLRKGKNASIHLCVKYRGFADACILNLPSLPWSKITPRSVYDKRTLKTYTGWTVDTHVCSWLTEQRYRWYPKGKKIVPQDVILDKNSILWWYIGDGHLHKKKSRPNYRQIVLATNGFLSTEVFWLIEKLKDILSDKNVYEEQNKIIIARTAVTFFARLIGINSPVPEYVYKFDFGQYLDPDYFKKSFEKRPIMLINKYRRIYKVRELDFEKVKQELGESHG